MAHESLYHIGAKAIIHNQAGQYLVTHVSRSDGYAYWDIPGGRIEEGETAIDALRREINEELGVTDLTIERPLLMALTSVRLPLGDGKYVGIVLDSYLCSTRSGQIKLGKDLVEAKWCSQHEASQLLSTNRDYPQSVLDMVAGL